MRPRKEQPWPESLWAALITTAAPNCAPNLHDPGVSPHFLGAAALGKAAPAPPGRIAALPGGPSCTGGTRWGPFSARFSAQFSILHPSFPGTTPSPRNPSQGKTTTTKSQILPQQRCEAFVEIRFFLFQSQKNQGWKWEASKGLRAHLFPKKPL